MTKFFDELTFVGKLREVHSELCNLMSNRYKLVYESVMNELVVTYDKYSAMERDYYVHGIVDDATMGHIVTAVNGMKVACDMYDMVFLRNEDAFDDLRNWVYDAKL